MKRFNIFWGLLKDSKQALLFGILIFAGYACTDPVGRSQALYANVSHQGDRHQLPIQLSVADTLRIDASQSSLNGQWRIFGDSLYFTDKQVVALRIYDREGVFARRVLHKGRGPNEILSPILSCCPLSDSSMVGITSDWEIDKYDAFFSQKLETHRFLTERTYSTDAWTHLRHTPNWQEAHMYEIDPYWLRIEPVGSNFVLPVTTEHIHYNGYSESCNASDFYRNSYICALLDGDSLHLKKLFGAFPPVYQDRIIPNFKTYSIAVEQDQILISFMADSLIYVWNQEGELSRSFGYSGSGISASYPETHTPEEAEEAMRNDFRKQGYYLNLFVANGRVFRSYRNAQTAQYHLQIYNAQHDLIGDAIIPQIFDLIGYIEPFYYAVIATDFEKDQFNLIRFTLCSQSKTPQQR